MNAPGDPRRPARTAAWRALVAFIVLLVAYFPATVLTSNPWLGLAAVGVAFTALAIRARAGRP